MNIMQDKKDLSCINWDKIQGLLPAIVQDINSGEVLMLGFMNKESLKVTLQLKKITFFSRTRNRLWTKGEISGNFLFLIDYTLDCDYDTLLLLVDSCESCCHLGTTSCFSYVSQSPNWIFFNNLEKLLAQRKNEENINSYTTSLYKQGTKRIAQKVGEEAIETALAATVNDNDELINEAADLVYHLTVLLQNQNLKWKDILNKLKERSILK